MTYELHLGDCLEYMKSMPGKSVDAVITDPPYGIGEHGGACRTRGRRGYSKHENKGWDKKPPKKIVFTNILRISNTAVIWGGNYFSDKLPPRMGWVYWRKLMGGDFSDGELAWTSRNSALKEFTKCPKGMDKLHPTQKPIELMLWCIENYSNIGDTIFDPFMGSGTTGVAAIQLGRNFIGCEIDPDYFKIAENRIKEAEMQPNLFTTQTPKATQEDLL
jgi:DNA modification methylase